MKDSKPKPLQGTWMVVAEARRHAWGVARGVHNHPSESLVVVRGIEDNNENNSSPVRVTSTVD